MKIKSFICDRCGSEIKLKGIKIIPMFFDTESEDMTEPVSADQEDRHYCHDCTKRILNELTAPSDEHVDECAQSKKEQVPKGEKFMTPFDVGLNNRLQMGLGG